VDHAVPVAGERAGSRQASHAVAEISATKNQAATKQAVTQDDNETPVI
jgi:hypothetical protein